MTEKILRAAKTKRARRKLGANPSQLWPQMPKISTVAARTKAYLRVAGLNTVLTKEALDPKLDLDSTEVKFGRLLASPEQRTRHNAVRRLNQYLTERCYIQSDAVGLSELDLLKLWKGLWYTLYMADRVPVQEELSKKLAELLWCVAGSEEEDEYAGKAYLDICGCEHDDKYETVMHEISNSVDNDNIMSDDDDNENNNEEERKIGHSEDVVVEDDDEENNKLDEIMIPHCRGAHLAALLVKTFFQTIRREWGRMDKYRIDKFYTVIRFMIGQVYVYMAKRHWNLGIVRLFNDTIYEQILSKTPNGIRLHLIDLTMEELAMANAVAPMPLTEATFLDVIEPYMVLSKSCDDKIVQARVVEKILINFLDNYSVISEVTLKDDGMVDSLIMDQVHIGTVADLIFTMGSDPTTLNVYRELLYDTFKEYKRRLKKIGKDVVLVDRNNEEKDGDSMEQEENSLTAIVDDPIKERNLLVDNTMTEETTGTKKDKKKKRMHQQDDDDVLANSGNRRHESNPTANKSRKKQKRRKAKSSLINTSTEEVETSKKPNIDDSFTNDQQGRCGFKEKDLTKIHDSRGKQKIEKLSEQSVSDPKKKPDYKKKKVSSLKADHDIKVDEIIKISLLQQEQAQKYVENDNNDEYHMEEEKEASFVKKKKKKKKKQKKSSDEEIRRVSFGRINHSKSHKASMRALKTMPSPKLEKVTPEKSILRSCEKGRKKAYDYFRKS